MNISRLDHAPTDDDITTALGRRGQRLHSPHNETGGWRGELIYFLMIDRFNDSGDRSKQPVTRDGAMRPAENAPFDVWRWDDWAVSGRNRFQGGTLRGVIDQLDYLVGLGITTIWLSPPWRQRASGVDVNLGDAASDDPYDDHSENLKPGQDSNFQPETLNRDDYHGYAVHDFLDIDPRFGTIDDLVDLVQRAHNLKSPIRVVLDIQLNHTGVNFAYAAPGPSDIRPPYAGPAQPRPLSPPSKHGGLPYPQGALPGGRYPFGAWLDVDNRPVTHGPPYRPSEAVWPKELQNEDWYSRKGEGSYGEGDFDLPHVEFRDSDFRNRDLRYRDDVPSDDPVLETMVRIWTWWMATTDCDGFRIDAIKHVPPKTAASFAKQIRTFANSRLGKDDFLVVGEVGGSDAQAATYLRYQDLRVLSLDHRRWLLRSLAGGATDVELRKVLQPTPETLDVRNLSEKDRHIVNGLDREALQERVVCTIDDHDGLGTSTGLRLACEQGPGSVLPAVALLFFGPGVPCLYYGTEQALTGVPHDREDRERLGNHGLITPDNVTRSNAEGSRGGDRFLREAMFGPTHPIAAGSGGITDHAPGAAKKSTLDRRLPGFGPTVTGGASAFDRTTTSPWYTAIAALAAARRRESVLAVGDIEIIKRGRVDDGGARSSLPVGLMAWTRTLPGVVAVLVVYAANRDQPPPAQGHRVSLELPQTAIGLSFRVTEQVCTTKGFTPAANGQSVTVHCTPQAQLAYLDLGVVVPGEVRVLIARTQAGPGPTATVTSGS